ncbi:GCN5-related N-acetyltransferase [Pseudofrankia inefficax]|uniref:GCN5-related N-acetyltransferase n=1 Tax=Pseudofrankia inefficax (strain DSM 45817 / CECT 9037 / DDB 130130 / EuI1c) TaxID=298654 RepID=E3J3F1_PSEI1|nr:GCN5-related N-acetyltransferase [Pseudofrankia inefficax]
MLPGPPPAAARALRTAVFVEEQGVPAELEHDAADLAADHAVVWDEAGEALATARLLDPAAIPDLDLGPAPVGPVPDGPVANRFGESVGVIGRVAVRPDARGRGLARAVTIALERRAAERGLTGIRLHAQAAVAGLYLGLGYETFGPPDRTAGIDHVWMRRSILPGLRPVRDDDGPAVQRLIGAVWAEYPGCVLDVDGEEPWMRAPATAYTGDLDPARYRGRMWVVEDRAVEDEDAGRPGVLAASVAVRETAPGRVELKSLYVAASARRRGLGQALVFLVEREARRRDAQVVELWSDTRFSDAHRLYERLGYRGAGRTRDLHDLSNTTEIHFTKDLLSE